MIKNIIFDWSGTLLDNVRSFHQIYLAFAKQLGGREISLEELRMNFDMPYMKFWNKYFPDLTKEDQDRLFEQATHRVEVAHLHPGVKELLAFLHSRKILLFILSSDPASKLIPETKNEGIHYFMQEIHCRIYEKEQIITDILKRNFLKAEETMYVGDTAGDVEAGKNAGVKTVGVSWGFQHVNVLRESKPDYIFDDLTELRNIIS